MVVYYADAEFVVLRGHENPQDLIFARSSNGFVVNFSNYTLLWVSKIQTYIAISTLHSGYVALSHSVIDLLHLKIIIKEVIDNLFIDSENLRFFSSSTIYEDNSGDIVMTTIPKITTTSKQISFKFHWFMHHVGKEFVIHKIDSENQKVYIFTKGLQGNFFRIRRFLCGY